MPLAVIGIALVVLALVGARRTVGTVTIAWPAPAGPRLVARAETGVLRDEAPTGQTQRRFGASREGARLHAGIDLPLPSGSPVVAMDDGIVLGILPGYVGLDAVAVDHPGLGVVVVYAEFARGAATIVGARVRRGGALGQSAASAYGSMLHVETWERSRPPAAFTAWPAAGPRPSGLLDPTRMLLQARAS